MKKFYKYTLLLIAAFLFAPLAAIAQDSNPNPQDPTNTLTGLGFTKNVTPDPNKDNAYNITLTAFTTGSTVSQEISATVPVDIVLVIDCSYSMRDALETREVQEDLTNDRTVQWSNSNNNNTTTFQATPYRIVINGQVYRLRVTRSGNNNNRRYAYAYNSGTSGNGTTIAENLTSQLTVQNVLSRVSGATRIYTSSTETISRMRAAREAAKAFVETVNEKNPKYAADATYHPGHRISIVKFGTTAGSSVVRGLTELDGTANSTAVTTLKNDIDGLTDASTTMGTESGRGLELAYGVLSAVSGNNDDHRPKVTVFFTDGEPGRTDLFSASIARTAVHWAYELKNLPTQLFDGENLIIDPETNQPMTMDSKVYCVALLSGGLSDETSAANDGNSNNVTDHDVRRYLHYVSSNYKFDIADYSSSTYYFGSQHTNATQCYGDEHPEGNTDYGNEAPHGYYFLTGGDDLEAIFTSIAASSSGTPEIPLSLKSTDIVAVDVVSHSFKLPEGANASAIQVMVAPFTGIDETGDYTDAQKSRLEHYQFGTPVTYAAITDPTNEAYDPEFVKGTPQKDSEGKIIKNDGVIQYESTYAPAATIDPNNRQKISVTGYNYADNWCGFDKHTDNTGTHDIPHGYELVIVIPIEVDAANPGGASVDTNDPTSGIYITNEDGTTTFAGFPQPVVTLPNIIIRKYGLIYKGEGASFLLEKLNDAGTAVDTSVAPYRIVVVAADDNPNTFDFVQVKLQQPGRYRVTETDWGWSYVCTVKEGDMQEDNDLDPNKTLLPTTNGTNDKGQPWIARDVSGDTEQTITLPGGSNLAGAVYDFQNTSKQHEHRNYSEAHKLNEFKTVFNNK